MLWRTTFNFNSYFRLVIDDLVIYCFIGHPAKETLQLVNEENIPFTFSFSESSCHTEGYASSLTVEPMSGTVQPKARYGTLSHLFITNKQTTYTDCMVNVEYCRRVAILGIIRCKH